MRTSGPEVSTVEAPRYLIRRVRKDASVILPLLLLLLPGLPRADIRTFRAAVEYHLIPGDNLVDAGRVALIQAAGLAWIKAGTYMETRLGAGGLDLSSDDVMASVAALAPVMEDDRRVRAGGGEDGKSMVLDMQVHCEFDPVTVAEQIKTLQADKETSGELRGAWEELVDLRELIRAQTDSLRAAGDGERAGLVARRRASLASNDATALATRALLVLGGRDGTLLQPASTTYDRRRQALDLVREALRGDPENRRAHRFQGIMLSKEGDYEAAAEAFVAALRIDPTDSAAHVELGLYYRQADEIKKAVIEFLLALKFDPENYYARLNYADALRGMEDYSTAVEQYERLLRMDPDSGDALIGMGIVLSEIGRGGPAVENFLRAMEVVPDDPRPHYYLGLALERSGDAKAAVEQFEKCISLTDDPDLIRDARERIRKLR